MVSGSVSNATSIQIQKTSGEGTVEQMKQLRAENVELKKELLRLQHLEDQVQLLREENELLKEQNASLKQQTMVCNKKLTFFCKLVYIYTERQHIYIYAFSAYSVTETLCGLSSGKCLVQLIILLPPYDV